MFVGFFSFLREASYSKVKNIVFLEEERKTCDLRTTVSCRIYFSCINYVVRHCMEKWKKIYYIFYVSLKLIVTNKLNIDIFVLKIFTVR
jgi:hypothetical protein